MADVALEFLDFGFAYAGSDAGSDVDAYADADEAGASAACANVLERVSWRCSQGDFALLVGATGSGKTTLLRCVKPELAPRGVRTGSVRVFGRDACELGVAESAGLVGYVAQSADNQLVCDSVWHQLAFGLENLGMDADQMRRRVAEVAHFFGIEPWLDANVNELSGGQKQLLNLASVLVMRPRVLLLDEPTAELDPVAEKNFSHALFRLNRELGLTIVVATHAPEQMVDYATSATCLVGGVLRPVELAKLRAGGLRAQAFTWTECAAGSGEAAASLADARVRYGRDLPWVLRGVDLEVRRGCIHALVGGNASGKSTLLQAIAGTLKAERGSVRNACAQSQALLPQNPKALFTCDTVLDELREWQPACGYSDEEAFAALALIGLEGATARHPYDLSGGQQQLLALVKLLLAQPELLLLDEPTKGLDATCKIVVARLLVQMRQRGAAVFMATHDLAFAAAVADEVSMLFDGQIACTQPTAQFFEENLFYRPVADAFWRAWEEEAADGASGEGR